MTMTHDRRRFLQTLAAGAAAFGTAAAAAQTGKRTAAPARPGHTNDSSRHHGDMHEMPASWTRPDKIAMLLYPGMTALDFVGPQYFFGSLMGATVYHVARAHGPVKSDTELSIVADATFDEVPKDLDVLFVPGAGGGVLDAMEDDALMAFVADRGARAKWVTSVCTGSLLLGKAGLLKGYRATGHWVVRDLLADFGATPVDARMVRDRNRMTAAGVSAGLDLGLALTAELRDRAYAETMQLLAEYAPQPPFDAGTPKTAPKAAVDMMTGMFTGFRARARRIARDAP